MGLNEIHNHCGWHEKEIINSKQCACFHCLSFYPPDSIREWITESPDSRPGPGKTAICPVCGIDSVLPESSEYELNRELLEEMQDLFF